MQIKALPTYKTRIQVRHGQGIHNVEGDKDYNAYMKPEYFDAHLTPLGWQEVVKHRSLLCETCLERISLHESRCSLEMEKTV